MVERIPTATERATVRGYRPPLVWTRALLSRELSRLEFGARLLDLGGDQRLPILERCKFVAIFADMVDEFFQVRVVSLEDKVAAGVQTPSLDGVRPRQQLSAIRERVMSLMERQDRLVLDQLLPELADAGLAIVHYGELDEEERLHLSKFFNENVYPVLTPLAVDPGHPFPMISNLSLNIAVTVLDPVTGEERSARVKVPTRFRASCTPGRAVGASWRTW